MKKTITILTAALLVVFTTKAQINLIDFESLVLPTDSFYQDTTGADWASNNAFFPYSWDTTYGYWDGGFSYSNKTDSVTSGYSNQHSAKTAGGYNNSANYVVAEGYAILKFQNPAGAFTNGVYVTNATYAYNSMRDGDMFAKKFGGSTGNDPDWFKLVIRSYAGGVLTNDSVEFYLADYRFSDNTQDYIVKTWQYVDLTSLGPVDSLLFLLSSTDNSFGYMNTPAFFCIDNFSSTDVVTGLKEVVAKNISLFPNPATTSVTLSLEQAAGKGAYYEVTDLSGKTVMSSVFTDGSKNNSLNIESLQSGVYFVRLVNGSEVITKKFTKE